MSTRTDNMKAFGASAAVTALGVGGTLAALSTRSFVPAAIVTLAFLTVDFLTVSAVKTCYGSTKSALIGMAGGTLAGVGGIALAFNVGAANPDDMDASAPLEPQTMETQCPCPQALPTLRAKACPLPAQSPK